MRIIEAADGGAESSGEQALVQSLAQTLDDSTTLFRGLRLPQAAQRIDVVLVGAFGVVVITVFEYEGSYACDGDAWFYSLDGGRSWRAGQENPVKQAIQDHDQLQAHLAQGSLRDIPIASAVALPSDRTRVAAKNAVAWLLPAKEWQTYAHELMGQVVLAQARVNEVVAVLEQVAGVRPTARPMVSAPRPVAPAAQPAPKPRPARRRAGGSLTPWTVAVVILLACNGGVCCGFVLAWLSKNPL